MKYNPKRRLIIDADSFAYTIGNRVMRPLDLGDGNVTGVFSKADIAADVCNIFTELFRQAGSDNCVLLLSDPDASWRREVYPAYKQQRKPGSRPMAYGAVREELACRWETIMHPRMEADDLCGVLSTTPGNCGYDEQVIVSPDKDLLTIPGFLFNPTHLTMTFVSQEDADRNHMMQTLCGDRADNYPGLPGVGPKKADKILASGNNLKEWWALVLAAYENAEIEFKDAVVQAQLANILRHGQYDMVERIIRPWEPPQ